MPIQNQGPSTISTPVMSDDSEAQTGENRRGSLVYAGPIRRLNWATYTVDTDGKNQYIRDNNWLTDGNGDYVRHYLRAMASAPELAPDDQNHLLRTNSVIRSVEYGGNRSTCTKFDVASAEEFKMGAWQPKSVRGGKMKWNATAKVLRVWSDATEVTLFR